MRKNRLRNDSRLSGRLDRRLAWLLIIPMFLACNLTNRNDELTTSPSTEIAATMASGDATPAEAADSAPTSFPPAMTPTVNIVPAGPLPTALYFVGTNGQIMRLEVDGATLSQITNEPQAIDDFDVSPFDTSLIFVSGNALVQTDAFGGNRLVKAVGGTVDPNNPIGNAIGSPHYSPDGQQISFGLNGINVMPSGSATQFVSVQPSDPIPDFSDPNNPPNIDGPVRIFYEGLWSRDGQRLAVSFGYYPEGGGMAIKELTGGRLIDVTNNEFITCCDWAWTVNGSSAYLASNLMVYGAPGLALTHPFFCLLKL